MATQTDIINLALYKLAQSQAIPNMADQSKAADVFNRLWVPTRDRVLAARPWPWAMKSLALALSAEAEQPGWGYRYAYPNDCLTAYAVTDARGLRNTRHLIHYADPDFLNTIWGLGAFDWETSHGTSGTTINTDVKEAYLVYCVRVEDTGRYPAHFVDAFACLLAAEGAPPMIGDVGLNSKRTLMEEYTLALTYAGAHSLNEGRSDQGYVTPSIAARGGN